jgi:hypothetical protein
VVRLEQLADSMRIPSTYEGKERQLHNLFISQRSSLVGILRSARLVEWPLLNKWVIVKEALAACCARLQADVAPQCSTISPYPQRACPMNNVIERFHLSRHIFY